MRSGIESVAISKSPSIKKILFLFAAKIPFCNEAPLPRLVLFSIILLFIFFPPVLINNSHITFSAHSDWLTDTDRLVLFYLVVDFDAEELFFSSVVLIDVFVVFFFMFVFL